MRHLLTAFVVTVGVVSLGLLVGPTEVRAQESESSMSGQTLQVDENLAKQGSRLWLNKGCEGCHTIGKGPSSGPDLKDVHQRRDMDWLVQWLTDTDEMLDTDPVAQEMLAQFNNTRMPDLKLREREARALIHYIAQRSQK